MKIFWSPLAVERLESIFEYISKDDSVAAHKIIERIFKKVESLSKFPEATREEIREVFESNYRIIYRLDAKKLFILTIRNFKQLLPEKDLE